MVGSCKGMYGTKGPSGGGVQLSLMEHTLVSGLIRTVLDRCFRSFASLIDEIDL